MTEALFPIVSECEEECREKKKRRLNVSGVLKILGVSRSGYMRFKKKVPSGIKCQDRMVLPQSCVFILNREYENFSVN